jgi:hypothetical protein
MDRLVDLQDQVEHLRELLADAIGDRDRARTIAVALEQEVDLLSHEIDRDRHEYEPGTDPDTCGVLVEPYEAGEGMSPEIPCGAHRLAFTHWTARRIVEQHQKLRDEQDLVAKTPRCRCLPSADGEDIDVNPDCPQHGSAAASWHGEGEGEPF